MSHSRRDHGFHEADPTESAGHLRPVRELSAVMFADIAGYTAMMQKSEVHAITQRDTFRSALVDLLRQHDGSVVQHYGDGTLAVFPSAVQATSCARMLQRAMVDSEVPLRIGLNVGDIVRDREGAYGDGVNLAARVQALCPVGAVLLSDRVASEVANHPSVPVQYLGAFELKNVRRPVDVYAVVDGRLIVPSAADLPSGRRAQRSIAVLPFENLSDDPSREFFSDGITEEVINVLAQRPGLKVTSRTSAFAFKRTHTDIRDIAAALGVNHVLEGSVRGVGDRVRVTAQLIEAQSGFHLFSERWDREMSDVLLFQDELSEAICSHLEAALGGVEESDRARTGKPHPRAYTAFLEARHHWNSWSPEGALLSIDRYRDAIQLDANLPRAHAGMATSFVYLGILGRLAPAEAYSKAKTAATQALAIQKDCAEAEAALALTALYYEWDRSLVDYHFERALGMGPATAMLHHYRGCAYSVLERHAIAIGAIRSALDLDPLSAPVNADLARALLTAGRTADALVQIDKTVELAPNFRSALEIKALIQWALGEPDAGVQSMIRYRSLSPDPQAGAGLMSFLLNRTGDTEQARHERDGLLIRQRQDPNAPLDVDIAIAELGLENHDAACARMQRAIERRAAGAILAWSMPIWAELSSDPRFRSLRRQIGLWGSA